jgi:hypothetical protein
MTKTPPRRCARPANLAGIEIPESALIDPETPWLALSGLHTTEHGDVDVAALTTRLRGLALAALDVAQRIEVAAAQRRPDARQTGLAVDLVEVAENTLGVHVARRIQALRREIAIATTADSPLPTAVAIAERRMRS